VPPRRPGGSQAQAHAAATQHQRVSSSPAPVPLPGGDLHVADLLSVELESGTKAEQSALNLTVRRGRRKFLANAPA